MREKKILYEGVLPHSRIDISMELQPLLTSHEVGWQCGSLDTTHTLLNTLVTCSRSFPYALSANLKKVLASQHDLTHQRTFFPSNLLAVRSLELRNARA